MRVSLGDDVEDRPVGGQRHILLEPRDPEAGLAPDIAARRRVSRQLAADNLQQRRLAGAVAADDGYPLARLDLKRNFIQKRQMAERNGDTVQRNNRHYQQYNLRSYLNIAAVQSLRRTA